ncbi:MAG: asparagine synthase (glutamine-hydrolyzing) [bacterium]
MCGIAGWVTNQTWAADSQRALERMTRALAHRGPDDEGFWLDEGAGVALGHRRLSIIDLSPEGRQPMVSASGRYVIIFNGEVYNFMHLRRQLEEAGDRFRSRSDTEVMLAAVSRWGVEDAVRAFNGMFALALWDRQERVLHLVRDRVGKKPLYYGWTGGYFLFGSELKALRQHPAFRGTVDRRALALYLRYGHVPAPATIYQGVAKLPPGTILTLSLRDPAHPPAPRPYWSMSAVVERGLRDPFVGSELEAVQALEDLLRDAVGLRMVADVPLGAFLSGGIDSPTVVALMQAQSPQPVRTFSIGFHEAGYDEASGARALARHLGTDHTELYVTPREALDVIPSLPGIYDEPFGDSSQIPTCLVSRLARRHVTVSLTGDGGDEFFGGYDRYAATEALWHTTRHWPAVVRRFAATLLTIAPPRTWQSFFTRLGRMGPPGIHRHDAGERLHRLAHMMTGRSPEEIYGIVVSPWADEVIAVGTDGPAERSPVLPAAFPDLLAWMMYLDAMTYLPDDLLVKVDRASMAIGLEVRAPFLDHRIIEFAWRLPRGLKVRQRQGKWIVRQVLARHVPAALTARAKKGFGVPVGDWLRGPLRPWVEELLNESRLRSEGFLRPAPIRRVWREHLNGSHNWDARLWHALMFQAWFAEQRALVPTPG